MKQILTSAAHISMLININQLNIIKKSLQSSYLPRSPYLRILRRHSCCEAATCVLSVWLRGAGRGGRGWQAAGPQREGWGAGRCAP